MMVPRVADLFTLGNLCAGFMAVLGEDVRISAGLIVLGGIFDFLDGWVARLMKQESPIGLQLDSLADLVTFGVAPAVLLTRIFPADTGILVAAAILPLASAWRLAVFNLLPPAPWFSGLPTPSNAMWYVGLALWVPSEAGLPAWMQLPAVHVALSLALSALMVSPVRFFALKSGEVIRKYWWIPALTVLGAAIPVVSGHPGLALTGALTLFLLGNVIGSLAGSRKQQPA